jgi:hypothetical protein
MAGRLRMVSLEGSGSGHDLFERVVISRPALRLTPPPARRVRGNLSPERGEVG